MKIIGVTHSGYPTKRNISSLPFERYSVKRKYDIFKFPEYLIFKLTKKTNPLLFNLHQDFGFSKCDIFHFFNAISFSKTPWVTTFETKIPRLGNASKKYVDKGVKLLAGNPCKKLIAMSECAKNMELDFIKREYPQYFDAIEKKLIVIYPSQKLLVSEYTQKKLNDSLSFIMVGSEFFVKGGLEVLRAFDKLLTKGRNINLYVISRMEIKGFATENERLEAMEIIKKHPKHIFYYPYLPNADVLNLFSQCHVAFLPTYADTFGYSVLEAQASGCPVITTDIRALAEINNDAWGWVVHVPRDEFGVALIKSAVEKQIFSDMLLTGLENILLDIIAKPEQIEKKGVACIERIKEKYNPEKRARELEEIYDVALAHN